MSVATFEPRDLRPPSTLRRATLPLWRLEPVADLITPDPSAPAPLPPGADEETGPSLVSERRARRAWTFGAIAGGALVTVVAVSMSIATTGAAPPAAARPATPAAITPEVAPMPLAFEVPSRGPSPRVPVAESPATPTGIHVQTAPATAHATSRMPPPAAQVGAVRRKPVTTHPRTTSISSTAANPSASAEEVAAAAKLLAQSRRESAL